MIVKGKVNHKLKKNICISDARVVYDALDRESFKSKETQVALVTAEIKQVMAVAGLLPRWMAHNEVAVDGLTKGMK